MPTAPVSSVQTVLVKAVDQGLNNPLAVLYRNHEFGLLFFLVPAAVFLLIGRRSLPPGRQWLIMTAGLGLCWFLVIGVFTELRQARYFMVCAYSASLLVAVWLSQLLAAGRQRAALAGAALLLGSYAVALYVDNKQPLFAEQALADYVAAHPGTVYADPATAALAGLYLRWRGLEGRVIGAPPPPGAQFFYNPNRVAVGDRRVQKRGRSQPFQPADYTPVGAEVLWQRDPGRKLSGRLLEALGLAPLLPPGLYRKLNRPNRAVTVYRMPAATGGLTGRHPDRAQ